MLMISIIKHTILIVKRFLLVIFVPPNSLMFYMLNINRLPHNQPYVVKRSQKNKKSTHHKVRSIRPMKIFVFIGQFCRAFFCTNQCLARFLARFLDAKY